MIGSFFALRRDHPGPFRLYRRKLEPGMTGFAEASLLVPPFFPRADDRVPFPEQQEKKSLILQENPLNSPKRNPLTNEK